MSETEVPFNKLQFSMMFGQDQVVVRSQTGDDLLSGIQQVADNAAGIHTASVAIRNAMGVMKASEPTGTATETKTYSRKPTSKPGPRQPVADDVPMCECGIPMSDVRGKVYQKGPKAGQPYPKSFYPSRDCKANCDAL